MLTCLVVVIMNVGGIYITYAEFLTGLLVAESKNHYLVDFTVDEKTQYLEGNFLKRKIHKTQCKVVDF